MPLLPALLGLVLTTFGPAARLQGPTPARFETVHRGHNDLSTGLYVRRDEDLVVDGSPRLILRRTYLANYRTSKQFGIGATHNGEIYLSGDFQQIALIDADGSRIMFHRRPGEPSVFKAIWVHESGVAGWVGAEMRFALFGWRIRRRDGSELSFQGCGPGTKVTVCSIIQTKDPTGGTINYRRDFAGRLTRIEAEGRWIAFDYDTRNRITRARGSSGATVEYQYDHAGRLWQVFGDEGRVHRYVYTDEDRLARIYDPGHTLENTYDANGRIVRQVNRWAGDPDPLVWTWSYEVKDGKVTATESADSDGETSRYRWDEKGRAFSQDWSLNGKHLATLLYERDPATQALASITLTCYGGATPERTRHPIESDVEPVDRVWAWLPYLCVR